MPLTIENLVITIVIVIMVFMVLRAKIKLITAKKKYSKIKTNSKLSGIEIARKILDANDLTTFYILENTRNYQNYYDTARNVIYLSSNTFNGEDLFSMAISAQQAGLAIQSKNNGKLFNFRNIFLPIMNIILYFGYIMLVLTIITRSWTDIKTITIIFGLIFIFHLITLPLDYKASKIAKNELIKLNLLNEKESQTVDIILNDLVTVNIASIIDNIINDLISLRRNNHQGR